MNSSQINTSITNKRLMLSESICIRLNERKYYFIDLKLLIFKGVI